MLIHIVVWKYNDETSEEQKSTHRENLSALEGLVPGMKRLLVGADVLHLDRSYDTGLVVDFEDEAALEAYTVHPLHQDVARLGKTLASHVASVDFLV